jgi:uncharacterized protein
LLNVRKNSMPNSVIKVEVVYATPEREWIIPVMLSQPHTVQHAIAESHLIQHCPEINLSQQKVGVFSIIVALDHLLTMGDRVEIYRPLPIDPMTRRFQKVKKERKKC